MFSDCFQKVKKFLNKVLSKTKLYEKIKSVGVDTYKKAHLKPIKEEVLEAWKNLIAAFKDFWHTIYPSSFFDFLMGAFALFCMLFMFIPLFIFFVLTVIFEKALESMILIIIEGEEEDDRD